ncbi:MAG: hypothetical protein ACPIOQ_26610, partial [Promethearchaeia archaeon]
TNPGQLRKNVSRAMRKLLDKKLIADAPAAVPHLSPLRASSATWPAPAAHASRRGAGGEGLAATCHTHRCVSAGLIPACARSSPRQVMEERMIDFAWTLVDWRTFDSVGRALCCTPLPLLHLPIAPLTRPNAVEPAADVPGLQPHCHAKRSKRKVSNMPLSWQG